MMIPASLEVIEHAIKQHEHDDRWKPEPGCAAVCTCGSTVLILCGECGAPLYMAIRPDRQMCRHGREAYSLGTWSAEWRYAPREVLTAMLIGSSREEGENDG